ncbi:helix-turn-helix domain-containing protein [Legionella cardiaca]|uniref:Helix-turn-helix domain-containing protein n=1 Tax=Legionella cardiaca TaxID=1071983 RepID=A0ABY8AT58_9GAMM|nr:helix-turn-helix domain-containing protein [Legionella cardiaca]WED43847.1 helix-turn-helix domain-containing protein [Legionella cardiaca]
MINFPLIKSIEIHDNDQQQTILPYTVSPDLYIVLGYQYTGSLLLLNNNENIQLSRCGLSGLQTNSRKYQCSTIGTKTLLIKFYPWAMACLINEPSENFINNAFNFCDLITGSAHEKLEELLSKRYSLNKLTIHLKKFFNHLQTGKANKRLDYNFIALIQQTMSDSNYQTKYLEEISGYTIRTIERRFKELVGLTPKKFLLLKRFQSAVKFLNEGLSWKDIVEKCNYYDQAHFINDFKEFSNMTPSQV